MTEILTVETPKARMKPVEKPVHAKVAKARTGADASGKRALLMDDLLVRNVSNRFAWGCPSSLILDFYNEHISDRHLEIGAGMGCFLDQCTFPQPKPLIALAGLNQSSVALAAKHLQRYQPSTHVINALKPFWIRPAGFESIGINFLLHRLPGDLRSKRLVFQHAKPLLNPAKRCVIFGTTILGKGVQHNPLARALMLFYNANGIFGNHWDSPWDLEYALKTHFCDYEIRVQGCVAFFVGRT